MSACSAATSSATSAPPEGRLLRHDSLLPGVDPFDSGCNAHEPLFAFWKPAAPAAERAAA